MTIEAPQTWDPSRPGSLEERMAQQAEVAAGCPVAWTDHGGGSWTLMRYDEVTKTALDPSTFVNGARPRYGKGLAPLETDPPVHTVYRRVLQAFFKPERVKQLEPVMREAAAGLIEPLVNRGEGDLAAELSWPLPVFALCAILDLPMMDWPKIKRWSVDSLLDPSNPDDRRTAGEAHASLMDYARSLVADRRRNPKDPSQDVTSAMLSVALEGVPIDDETAAGNLRLLISAGHNSTTSALGNILAHLAVHRQDQDELRRNPGAIPTAIEEFLRFYTPVQEMPRHAARDTEIAGCPVHQGDRIGIYWSSANRDPAVFADPDQVKLDRKPNRHVAFGYGIHMCLGAPVARMELRVAVEELLARTSGFESTGEVLRPPFHRIGVDRLPVRLSR